MLLASLTEVTVPWSKSSLESSAQSVWDPVSPLYMALYQIILVTWLLCMFPLLITGSPLL